MKNYRHIRRFMAIMLLGSLVVSLLGAAQPALARDASTVGNEQPVYLPMVSGASSATDSPRRVAANIKANGPSSIYLPIVSSSAGDNTTANDGNNTPPNRQEPIFTEVSNPDDLNAYLKDLPQRVAALKRSQPAPAEIKAAQFGDVVYDCFPTCDPIDAKMLSLAGSPLHTLAGETLQLRIVVTNTATQFELGIFDGDTGAGSPPAWDYGTTPLEYTLYPGSTANAAVGVWNGNATNIPLTDPNGVWSADSASMPNNGWWNLTVNTQATALQGSNYVYFLKVHLTDITASVESSFKLRTTGKIVITANQNFAVVGALTSNPRCRHHLPYSGLCESAAPIRFLSQCTDDLQR